MNTIKAYIIEKKHDGNYIIIVDGRNYVLHKKVGELFNKINDEVRIKKCEISKNRNRYNFHYP